MNEKKNEKLLISKPDAIIHPWAMTTKDKLNFKIYN
jgi:hypothetical protein